jgi:hypothetical protein
LEPGDGDIYSDEDDFLTVGNFSGTYYFSRQKGYKAGIGFSHYQTLHDDLGDYNLTGSRLHLFTKHNLAPYTIGFSYQPSYYWLDTARLLYRHYLKPEIIRAFNQNLMIGISYGYMGNTYFENKNRDGHVHEIKILSSYRFRNKKVVLSTGAGYTEHTTSHADYTHDSIDTNVGVSFKTKWQLDCMAMIKYLTKTYAKTDSAFSLPCALP